MIMFVMPGVNHALVEISPEYVTTFDHIFVIVSGWWGSSCTPDRSLVTVVGNDIYFEVGHYVPPGICLTVMTPWSLWNIVDPLPAGTYTIYSHYMDDPGNPVSDPYTFEVSDNRFVLSTASLGVDEGGTSQFTVRLLNAPTSPVQAVVSRVSGDSDIMVQSGTPLTFDSGNYSTAQPVTLYAGEDADYFHGSAQFEISGDGYVSSYVSATEVDNDVPSILYVDITAPGANDGTSWEDAFTNLQQGLSVGAGISNVEMRVAGGLYTPKITSSRGEYFTLKNGMVVKGAYAGYGDSDPDKRNVYEFETILSGDRFGDDDGDFTNRDDNCWQIIEAAGAGPTTLLDGFSITGAEQNSIHDGSLVVSNCIIYNNRGPYGAGMRVYPGNHPIFKNCLFIGNDVTDNSISDGGALFAYHNTSLTLENCTFVENSASETGGALYITDTTPRAVVNIKDCIFWGNTADSGADETDQIYGNVTVINSSCVQGWTGSLAGTGFGDDPIFVTGPAGDHYLSQTAAGQGADSPCVDSGSDTAVNLGMDVHTTRTDQGLDAGVVDVGFHYQLDVGIADFDNSGDVDYLDFGLFGLDWFADTRYICEPNEVAWWAFDEGIDTTVYDSSVYGNDGNLVNDPNWVTGYDSSGSALSFNGIDEYIEVTGYKGISGTQSRTCVAWIKTSLTIGNNAIVSWGDYTASGGGWLFKIDTATGALRVSLSSGGYILGTKDLIDDQWHHVAAVLENDGTPTISDIKLYVDGVEEAVTVADKTILTVSFDNVKIGSISVSSTTVYFKGSIDDVRIYDFALTDEMIDQIYNQLPPSGLVCIESPAADFNYDCVVDINDLRIFAESWLWP